MKISRFFRDFDAENQRRRWHKEPLLPFPTKKDLEETFKGQFEFKEVLARIGFGAKVHKVTAEMLSTPDGYIIWSATSFCGSQKWSRRGKSPIAILSQDSNVTCDRCLGIRVKGGKALPPAKKRPAIDESTRPRKYAFKYSYQMDNGRIVDEQYETSINGMTKEEALEKLIKQKKRYGNKLIAYELVRVDTWNFTGVWDKKLGEPYKGR